MLRKYVWLGPVGALLGGLAVGKIGREGSEPEPAAGPLVSSEERRRIGSDPIPEKDSLPARPRPVPVTAEEVTNDWTSGSFVRLSKWIMTAPEPDLAAAWALTAPEAGDRRSVKRARALANDLILYGWAHLMEGFGASKRTLSRSIWNSEGT